MTSRNPWSAAFKMQLIAVFLACVSIKSAAALLGRYSHSSVYLPNTKQFVVFGGRLASSTRLPSVLVMSLPSGNPSDMVTTEYSFGNKSDPLASLKDASAGYDSNNNLVLLFGYDSALNVSLNSLYTLSIAGNKIATDSVDVASAKPNARFNAASTNINSSCIFIQGGTTIDDKSTNSSAAFRPLNGAFLYSTETRSFKVIPEPLPPSRWHHTATAVGEKVVLLGGTSTQTDTFDFYDIWVYTEANGFQYYTATGDVPDPRRAHSAVAYGKKVIVYGGTDSTFLNLFDQVFELDTDTYAWKKLYPLDEVDYSISPPGRYSHTAHIVGDQMFILFGFARNPNSTSAGAGFADSSIHVFDLKQNSWSYSAEAGTKRMITVPAVSDSNPTNLGLILGTIFASLIAVGLIVFGLIWYSRKNRKDREIDAQLEKLREVSIDSDRRDSSDQYSFVDTHPSMRMNRRESEPTLEEYAQMPPLQQHALYQDPDVTPRASMLR